MKKLIARSNILFESKMYAPGEELPTKNTKMVEAWLKAGTAYHKETKDIAEEMMDAFENNSENANIEIVEHSEDTESTETEATEGTVVKATAAAAEAGLPGTAVNSDSENGEDLVGKIPENETRKVGRRK